MTDDARIGIQDAPGDGFPLLRQTLFMIPDWRRVAEKSLSCRSVSKRSLTSDGYEDVGSSRWPSNRMKPNGPSANVSF